MRTVRRWQKPELWVPHPWSCLRPWMSSGQLELEAASLQQGMVLGGGFRIPSNLFRGKRKP